MILNTVGAFTQSDPGLVALLQKEILDRLHFGKIIIHGWRCSYKGVTGLGCFNLICSIFQMNVLYYPEHKFLEYESENN